MDIEVGKKIELEEEGCLRFSSEKEQLISKYFYENYGNKLGDVFQGALIVYGNDKNPERIFQSAHSFREMLSVLFDKYRDDKIEKSDKFKKIDDIITKSKKIPFVQHHLIHQNGYSCIKNLYQNSDPQLEQIKKFVFEAYGLNDDSNPYLESIANKLLLIFKNFTAISHHPTLRNILKNKDNQELIKEKEKSFESTLEELLNLLNEICMKRVNFYGKLNDIDEVIKKKNITNEDINTLLSLTISHEQKKYLYTKLNRPELLDQLNKRGIFSAIPCYIQDGEELRFPEWPEGNYLLNICTQKETEVFNIIKKLLEESHSVDKINPRFFTTVLDVAIKSKKIGSYSALIIKHNISKNKFLAYEISEKVSEIITRCIQSHQIKVAMELAAEIFDVDIEKRETFNSNYSLMDAKPIIESWHYKYILENISKILTQSRIDFIQMLCAKLDKCLTLENKRYRVGEYFEDYSYVWRRTLRGSSHDVDVKDILTTQIINEIEKETEKDKILEILNSYKYVIFLRIKLLLLSQNLNKEYIEIIYKLLGDRKLSSIYSIEKEYRQLLVCTFPSFSARQQQKVLNTILSEKLGLFKMIRILAKDKKIDYIKRVNRSIRYNKLQSLHAVNKCLEGKYKLLYNRLYSEFGEPTEIEEITSWSGPNSPLTLDDLTDKNPNDIFNYLKTWVPNMKNHGPEPSPEGLGRIFQEYIKKNADKFLPFAEKMFDEKIRLVYLYHFLSGIEGYIKNNGSFDWKPVINLCLKIAEHKNFEDFPQPSEDFEPKVESVKKATVRTVGIGLFINTPYTIDFKYRKNVFDIIRSLVDDPEPDLEYEAKYGGDNMDFYTLSINTVRGETLHSLMRYALWCLHFENKKELPIEVKGIVLNRLNLKIDNTLTTRAVIGHYLPQLFSSDKDWVLKNIDLILPKNNREFYLATWIFYLGNPIYEFIYEGLIDEYLYCLSYLSDEKEKRSFDFNKLLTQHIALSFIHNFKKSEEVMQLFLTKCKASHQIELISFSGRYTPSINDKNSKYSADERSQIKARMESMLSIVLSCQNVSPEALKEFGWWIRGGLFDSQWLLNNLIAVLKKTEGAIDDMHDVIGFLKNNATAFPGNVVEIIDLLIKQKNYLRNPWELNFEIIKEIFEEILKIDLVDKDVIVSISKITNMLGDVGFTNLFRDVHDKSISLIK